MNRPPGTLQAPSIVSIDQAQNDRSVRVQFSRRVSALESRAHMTRRLTELESGCTEWFLRWDTLEQMMTLSDRIEDLC